MFTLHSRRETNPGEGCHQHQRHTTATRLHCHSSAHAATQGTAFPVCINEEPTPFCEGVFFSGCFCFISIGESDIISVHGRKDFDVRTAGREEEKKGWTVATSEVGVCCGVRRGPRKGGVLPGLLWTGTHMGLGSSWDNRDLLSGRGGGCRIPPKKLLLCLFIILQRKQEEDLNEWKRKH